MISPEQCAARILKNTTLRPTIGLVLGSGFGSISDLIVPELELPYPALPGFLPAAVSGHPGKLVVGYLADLPVFVMCGRCHFYEGHSLAEITFPIRVLAACGIKVLLLTNAAGGINRRYRPGDLMCIKDHLNFIGDNPLRGCEGNQQVRFLDLSSTYDPQLNRLLAKAARRAGLRLHKGVYVAVCGPSYETPAEIRAFARLGADAIGMSTVPEAIVAKQCCLRVAGLSCITNAAAGLAPHPISHSEVLATGERVKGGVTSLLGEFVGLLGHELRTHSA